MELQSLSNHKTIISAMWDLRLTETMALPPPVCHFPLCRLCLGGSAHTCSKSYKQEEASWLGSITYPVHFTRHTPSPLDPLMRKIPTPPHPRTVLWYSGRKERRRKISSQLLRVFSAELGLERASLQDRWNDIISLQTCPLS